jgi:hypothetical protein
MLVDRDAAPIVGFDSRGREVQIFNGALAADCIEECVAGDSLFALEIGDDGSVRELLDAGNFFAKTHRHAAVAEMIAQRLDDFLVGEL